VDLIRRCFSEKENPFASDLFDQSAREEEEMSLVVFVSAASHETAGH
jgi:hypothetical protein